MRELVSPSSWLMEIGLCHSFLAKSVGLFSAALRAFPECFEIDERSKDCAVESHIRRYSSPPYSLELKSSPLTRLFPFPFPPLSLYGQQQHLLKGAWLKRTIGRNQLHAHQVFLANSLGRLQKEQDSSLILSFR